MGDEWKEKIIQEKLGGKRDWTDSERAELCRQLDQDLDSHINSLGKSKFEDGWTEENWKEKMAEHPLFFPYVQGEGVTEAEAPINPLSEGLAQLKFDPDHSTPVEIAQNYKEEGVLQFKYKKYRLAVANFTEGLKQKCDDRDLNAQILNNRAAAQYHLENNRSAIRDCEIAFKLKPDYVKVINRAVDCAIRMKSWDEVMNWCDRGLRVEAANDKFKKARLTAMKEKKIAERNERKKMQEEKKKEMEEQNLISFIESRGVKLGENRMKGSASITLADLEPCHPAAQGSRVHINENGELVWPVMLLYPEYQETDLIQEFSEGNSFCDHLAVMFGDGVPPAPWDTEGKYLCENMVLYFEDKEKNKLYEVDPNQTLQQVLAHPKYRVMGGTPGFIVLIRGSRFAQEFLPKYET